MKTGHLKLIVGKVQTTKRLLLQAILVPGSSRNSPTSAIQKTDYGCIHKFMSALLAGRVISSQTNAVTVKSSKTSKVNSSTTVQPVP